MKHRIFALLPFFVFVVIFAGAGIISKDFYSMPAYVAFLIALFIGFLQNKKLSFNDKLEVVAKGAGDVNIITMVLIFLVAGAFSGIVTAAGGVESTVNLGLSIIPPQFMVVGLFIIGCFISISMGNFHGNHHRTGSYRTGRITADQLSCFDLCWSCCMRRHVWRQPLLYFRYDDRGCKDTGLQDER